MYCVFRSIAPGLLAILICSACIPIARAQWSGSLSFGAEATNNVQELDTIAPDHTLMPAFELNYDVHPSEVSTVTLTGSISPEYYALNPALSYNETMFGATGVFYLTHQAAITSTTALDASDDELMPFPSSEFLESSVTCTAYSAPVQTVLDDDSSSKNDSLVDLAVSALYSLSGELDSTDIATNGLSQSQASDYGSLLDSISDVLSTAADLLDSIGYSQSTVEVLKGELTNLREPLHKLILHTEPFHTDPALLDTAVRALTEAKPEAEFLPTAASPIGTKSNSGANAPSNGVAPSVESEKEAEAPPAPRLTLISSDTRLRDFGYGEAEVYEDADDSDATTLATTLTIPVAYTTHAGIHYAPADTLLFGGNFGGNPNDSRELTFGATLEGLTSTTFSLTGSYAYTRTLYPFDSVYTNTENRFRLFSRFGFGGPLVLFPEVSVGFRNYLTPLSVVDTVTPQVIRTVRGKKDTIPAKLKTITAGSNFTQYTYGMGIANVIGQRWILGGLVAFTRNPNLRAYVTTEAIARVGKAKTVRAAVQIADDEYTYNLDRYTVFSEARIVGDIDFGLDFSIEHRVYGSEVGPKGDIVPGGRGRTEDGRYLDASLSRIFPFDHRILGVFNALSLEGVWELADVTASQPIYTYSESDFEFTVTLAF